MYSARRSLPTLSAEQQQAFDMARDFVLNAHRIEASYFVIHGLAGSGKTTVLAHLAQEFPHLFLCSLTGKAASILTVKTGMQANTVHSIFYRLREIIKNPQRMFVENNETLIFNAAQGEGAFKGVVLLLDELSMIDEQVATDMLRTGVKIIAFGDPGQLQPINGQMFFRTPNYTLTEIHRQALDNPIVRQAHNVRNSGRYIADGDQFRVTPWVDDKEMVAADAIICWKNQTRVELNRLSRQYRGLEGKAPQAGETVMALKNIKVPTQAGELALFNGATYTLLEEYKPFSHIMSLEVDGVERFIPDCFFYGIDDISKTGKKESAGFTYGYAMTCHKAQGSEFKRVIVIDEYTMREQRREWVYTALTRAAEFCTVVKIVNV